MQGAPGRIRTCGTRFRKPLLYPLSYEGGTCGLDCGKPVVHLRGAGCTHCGCSDSRWWRATSMLRARFDRQGTGFRRCGRGARRCGERGGGLKRRLGVARCGVDRPPARRGDALKVATDRPRQGARRDLQAAICGFRWCSASWCQTCRAQEFSAWAARRTMTVWLWTPQAGRR